MGNPIERLLRNNATLNIARNQGTELPDVANEQRRLLLKGLGLGVGTVALGGAGIAAKTINWEELTRTNTLLNEYRDANLEQNLVPYDGAVQTTGGIVVNQVSAPIIAIDQQVIGYLLKRTDTGLQPTETTRIFTVLLPSTSPDEYDPQLMNKLKILEERAYPRPGPDGDKLTIKYNMLPLHAIIASVLTQQHASRGRDDVTPDTFNHSLLSYYLSERWAQELTVLTKNSFSLKAEVREFMRQHPPFRVAYITQEAIDAGRKAREVLGLTNLNAKG